MTYMVLRCDECTYDVHDADGEVRLEMPTTEGKLRAVAKEVGWVRWKLVDLCPIHRKLVEAE